MHTARPVTNYVIDNLIRQTILQIRRLKKNSPLNKNLLTKIDNSVGENERNCFVTEFPYATIKFLIIFLENSFNIQLVEWAITIRYDDLAR